MAKKIHKSVVDFLKKWPDNRKRSELFRKEYDETFLEIDNFMRGNQWTRAQRNKPWMSTPIDNTLHKVKNAKLAMISETELRIKIKPLKSVDIDKADKLGEIIQSYYDHVNFTSALLETKKASRSSPIGYFKLKFDGSKLPGTSKNIQKGDFAGKSIAAPNVFWDPTAYNDETLSYIYEVHTLTIDELKNTAGYDQEVVDDIVDHATKVTGEDPDNGDVLDRTYSLSKDKKTVTIYEISYRWKKSPNSDYLYGEIHTALQDGNAENEISKRPLFAKTDLGTRNHFIIPLREYKFEHEFMGRSTVQLVLDKVKEINKIDAITSNIANQMQNVMKVVSSESGIDPAWLAKYGTAGGLVIVSKTEINNAIKTIPPVAIPSELLSYRASNKADIYDVANINNAASGAGVASLNSSDGVNKLIMQSQSQEVEPMTNYEDFLKTIIIMMSDLLIKNIKKAERRIDSKDPHSGHEYKFVNIDFTEFKGLRFDTSVDIVMTEYQKQQQKQEVMQIMSLQAAMKKDILTPEMIIKLFGFPDEDIMLSKMQEDKNHKNDNDMLDIAQRAAMIMANEIEHQDEQSENISIEQMAQVAATEAMQRHGESSEGQQEGQPQQGGEQQPSGAAAPQLPVGNNPHTMG